MGYNRVKRSLGKHSRARASTRTHARTLVWAREAENEETLRETMDSRMEKRVGMTKEREDCEGRRALPSEEGATPNDSI